MDAAFTPINQYRYTESSLVVCPPILGSMGVGKYARTPLTLIVYHPILSCTLGGIDGGFVPWENSSNIFKR